MSQAKRPTIRDVAREAGVSKSLVSMVFASDSGVSPERRERVLDAAKKLGFSPNPWARSLATGSGDFIAIVVVDLHNPLFTEIADQARKALLERGQQTFMTAASITELNGKKVLEKSTVQALLDLKPRGILVVGDLPDKNSLKSVPESVPIIFATTIPKGLSRAIVLRIDEDEGMRLIVDHLVQLGHQKICYLGSEDGEVASARIGGYRKAMQAHSLKPLEQHCDRTEVAGYAAAKLALQSSEKPTALVCFNDIVALGAQEAIDAYQKAESRQIALTGFDNTYISALNKISITSIEQEKTAIAMKAAEILSDEQTWREAEGKHVLLLPRLEIRASTAGVKI